VNKTKFPIVYYRMPHEKEICFVQSASPALEINTLQDIPHEPGFVSHPFASDSSCNSLFIEADKQVNISLIEFYANIKTDRTDWKFAVETQSNNYSKTKDEYCRIVHDAIRLIHSGEIQKVVLSRLKRIEYSTPQNPLKIFHNLCIKYPAAFVSFIYIPGEIVWITATPELLVSANLNEINTVSLAGTKPLENIDKWGEKEKMEQLLVTDYINKILEKYCTGITVSVPEEIIAGNVKHLKTSLSATLNTGLWNLVAALHPTPAVCGIPLDSAKQFIKQTEGYDRKYYTGFLGPCNVNGKTNLFVNLRCAELFANNINLYIGGGITKDSIPEKEWEETELKSKTLLSVLEDNKNEKQ
jgi:isochorismate synthase